MLKAVKNISGCNKVWQEYFVLTFICRTAKWCLCGQLCVKMWLPDKVQRKRRPSFIFYLRSGFFLTSIVSVTRSQWFLYGSHIIMQNGPCGLQKNEPISVTVAVFRVSRELPDRQLFRGIDWNCSGARQGTLRGFSRKCWNVAEYVGHFHAIGYLKTNKGEGVE